MHVGKSYPISLPRPLWCEPYTSLKMGRKRVATTENSLGIHRPLSNQWTSPGLSGVVQPEPSMPNRYIMVCDCPADPLNQLWFRYDWVEGLFGSELQVNYHWNVRVEIRYDGVTYGYRERQLEWLQGLAFGYPSNDYGLWSGLLDTSMFATMQVSLGTATWAQQPEYHPYRR